MRAASSLPARPPSPVDHNDLAELQKRLLELANELVQQAPDTAKARQVREYDGERRKRALALSVREHLKDGSASAAETLGRASIGYGEQLDALAGQLEAAESTIAHYDDPDRLGSSALSAFLTTRDCRKFVDI